MDVEKLRRPAVILGGCLMALCAMKLSLVLVSTQMFHASLLYFGDDGLVARFAGTAPRP